MKLKSFLIFVIWGAGIFLAFIFVTNLIIYIGSKAYIYKNVADVPKAQAVLIPGASVLANGQLSSIFKDRVDKAIELYNAKKVEKFLVSGDNSTVAKNEVNPARLYLLGKGIPDSDIFLDHAGFDTYSSMYRAADVFQVSSIIVSSQSFHLPRAVFIARALGTEAYGISADEGNILFRNYIREIFADEKVVFDLIFRIQPKYLGKAIPITGDGRDYP